MNADDEKPLPPLGTGGRDRAGVMAVFEGDPIPTHEELHARGYTRVVLVRHTAAVAIKAESNAGGKPPSMTFDAMPTRLAREPAIEANERYQSLYNRYFRGELPRWANKEFEQLLCQFANNLKELESEIATGRNGRPDAPRKKCLDLIAHHWKFGHWPGDLTDQQWADKWHVDLRTYQRAKQEFPEVLAERMMSKAL